VEPTGTSFDPKEIPVYLESGMPAHIDSTTAQIWLPRSACDGFEEHFRLEWNEQAQLYLINSTTYIFMHQQNATVEFKLDSTLSNGVAKTFVLPTAAFILYLDYPLVGNKTRYFAVRRATRADQYILGRAFLQSAHISVDYDSKYFNISQRRFGFPNETGNIVPIVPKAIVKPETSGLSRGAYVGIALGSVAAFLVGLLLLEWKYSWWPFAGSQPKDSFQAQYHKAELHDSAISRVEAMEKERAELENPEQIVKAGDGVHYHQVNIAGLDEVHEMHADEIYHPRSRRSE
jgi:hypothetical protein